MADSEAAAIAFALIHDRSQEIKKQQLLYFVFSVLLPVLFATVREGLLTATPILVPK